MEFHRVFCGQDFMCWPKENAKQRRERKYRSLLRKQAGHTDKCTASINHESGFGNMDEKWNKVSTSIAECLDRLCACLQRNEKLLGLLQELMNDKFMAEHQSDLDTSPQEACPCQFIDENSSLNEGSACQPLYQVLADKGNAQEPETAKLGFGRAIEIDEGGVFPQVPEERAEHPLAEGRGVKNQFEALEPTIAKCRFDQEIETEESIVLLHHPEERAGLQLKAHVEEGLAAFMESFPKNQEAPGNFISQITDYDGAYDRHCASCQGFLRRGHVCVSTIAYCMTCAVQVFRYFDPAINATCPYCLAVGRKVPHWCACVGQDIFEKALIPSTTGVARALANGGPDFNCFLHEKFGLGTLLGPAANLDRPYRYRVQFTCIPFEIEIAEDELAGKMLRIHTREHLVDVIIEYHWRPREHDLLFDAHPERGKTCELCGATAGRGCPRLSCTVCDYHLCQHCRIPQAAHWHLERNEV
jgi:hypothetical protein